MIRDNGIIYRLLILCFALVMLFGGKVLAVTITGAVFAAYALGRILWVDFLGKGRRA